MSDEQNSVKEEKKCNKKLGIVLIVLSLVMSFAALGLSVYNTVTLNNGAAQANGGKVLISKKYDKGQSLAKAYKKQKDREIKKKFAVAYVNCDKPENRGYMEQFNVQGFPTVYVINNDRSKVQLENNTFFNEDSADVIKTNMLNIIKEND